VKGESLEVERSSTVFELGHKPRLVRSHVKVLMIKPSLTPQFGEHIIQICAKGESSQGILTLCVPIELQYTCSEEEFLMQMQSHYAFR
jgi:hypothetical protein